MSDVWNEGYFTDVGYTYGYYREINPVFQRFCLLLRGFAAPEGGTAHHCELGFGQGVSVNIHAAANPGHFVATDFNPAHAAHASKLAAAAGTDARLYDDSFEQLLNRSDLPKFDSISLHGIWTWVNPDNHKIIVEFARRHLKPGGVFYNSYNCFPGWSPAYPLRQLFASYDRFAPTPNGVSERVDAALKFSEALLAANPNYAKAVPQLGDKLKSIMGQNRNYLAHEYFNRGWSCMYFTDVVDALAPAKLDYVTTAVPLDAVDAVNVPAEGLAFLNTIDHPILREQARDYFVNQHFRKDLYVRGAVRLSPIEQRERLLDTHFILVQSADSVPLKVAGTAGEATLQEPLYKPLIEALAAKDYTPKTLRQLMAAIPGAQYPNLQQALAVLVGMGNTAPCQPEAAEKQVRGRCQSLNRHLCERAQFGNEIKTLASSVTGGGIPVNRFQQLFLSAIKHGKKQPAEWAQSAWQVLVNQDQRIVKKGETLETDKDNLAELIAQATEFGEKRVPILKALHIL